MGDPILQEAKGKSDADKLNKGLAALKLAEKLMDGSNPTTHIINDQFALGHALYKGMGEYFIVRDDNGKPLNEGIDSVISVFDHFEEHSPSIGGIGREQVVECVINSGRTQYQGFNPLYEQEKPGAMARILAFLTNRPAG